MNNQSPAASTPTTRSRFNFAAALPYILVLLCGLIWGMNFSLARLVIESGAHPVGITFWQAFGGGLVLWAYCRMAGREIPVSRAAFMHATVIALCGTALPSTIYYYAAAHLPAGVLAITVALVPMATYALAWTLGLEKMGVWRLLGIVLGFLSVVLLMSPGAELPGAGAGGWLLLALVSVLCYAVEDVYVDARARGMDLIGLLALSLFIAALIVAPLMYTQNAFYAFAWPPNQIDLAVVAIIFVCSVAYVLFFIAIQIAGAVFASLVGYTITLAGVFWGIVFFAERHTLWVWAALALMLLGLGLVTPRDRRRE